MGLKSGIVSTVVLSIVLIIVLFECYAEIVPEAQTAGDTMTDEGLCDAATSTCFWNDSRGTAVTCSENNVTASDTTVCTTWQPIPLSGLVGSSGVLFIIIMAALVVLVVKSYITGKK